MNSHWRRRRGHMPRRRFVALLLTLALSCKQAPAKRPPPATPVRVAAAVRIDAPVEILASGVVEPKQSVAVTSQVSGSLLGVAFQEGDFVQRGQILFRIDPRPLAAAVDQARATLARDEAQAEAARKDDERYRTLAGMGYVSRSQADQMHATAVAQSASVEADRAALRSAEVNLGFATIRAPIAGRTGSLLVRQGNNVSQGGTPLVVINQLSPVLVRFPVLAEDFPALQQAVATRPLTVVAAASDSGGATESGELNFLDNAVDSLTGTVTGKANFINAGRRMWPGELVFLTIRLDVQRGVIAVPVDAVQTGQQGAYVYVVDARNTAQTRPVATGTQLQDMIVVQRGLNVGERVVIDGQSRLNPGSKVALVRAGADSGGTGGGARGQVSGELQPTTVGGPDFSSGGGGGGGARGGAGGASLRTAAPTSNATAGTRVPAMQTTPTTGAQAPTTSGRPPATGATTPGTSGARPPT